MRVVTVVIAIVILVGGFLVFNRSQNKPPTSQTVPIISPIPQEKVDIKASFKIITNGAVRIFTDSKYHHKSKDVFIELPDPSIVLVKQRGITWDDFFKSLPMKLTKECLTTGTGLVFCTGEGGSLKFYLNDMEDKDLLDRQIKDGDKILIQYN